MTMKRISLEKEVLEQNHGGSKVDGFLQDGFNAAANYSGKKEMRSGLCMSKI